MEVHHKLDEICQHFMAIKDVHLQQAAALLIAPPTTTRVAAPVPLPHRGKPSRTRVGDDVAGGVLHLCWLILAFKCAAFAVRIPVLWLSYVKVYTSHTGITACH